MDMSRFGEALPVHYRPVNLGSRFSRKAWAASRASAVPMLAPSKLGSVKEVMLLSQAHGRNGRITNREQVEGGRGP
jgi:hypothetical protein